MPVTRIVSGAGRTSAGPAFVDAPAAIEAAPVVAAILADELGWSAARTAESTEAFRRVAEGFL